MRASFSSFRIRLTPAALTPSLDAVVVVVKLGVRIDTCCRLEGQLDVFLAEDFVEDGFPVRAILVERLVDDIPGVAPALPMTGNVLDVTNDGFPQLWRRPVGRLDPRGKLAVPDERVAAEDLVLLLGQGCDDLALGVVEDARGRLREEPLHPIGRGGLPELLRVPEDRVVGDVRRLVASALPLTGRVGGRPEVQQPGLLGQGVKLAVGDRDLQQRCCQHLQGGRPRLHGRQSIALVRPGKMELSFSASSVESTEETKRTTD